MLTKKGLRALGAEAVGTFLLLATVVGSGIMGEQLSPGNAAVALLGNSIATGAILYVLISYLGPVSGAHFNPAVTLVFCLRRELPLAQGAAYIAIQVLFAVLGAMAAHAMFDMDLIQSSLHQRSGGGQWLGEVIATFSLLITILGAVRFRPLEVAPMVAMVIVAGYWFTSSTSFANPAVTLARSFTNTFSGIRPDDVAGFVLAQLAGALLAALVAHWLWSDEKPLAQ
ncbi:MAG: aquaporin family protein [Rhizobiales bacterium]|nr:aquaporin family protein [Hyphomicrobiales bacterium]